MSFHYMVPSSSTALIKGLFPMRKDISDYLGAKESHALPPIWPADIFLSASVLFDVICRATPPRSACTPYPPRRPTLCLSRLWESLFRKVRVKLSSQVSMSPPSSVNKCENIFLTTLELENYMLYQQSDRWMIFCQHQSCSMSFVEQRHLDWHVRRIHHGVWRYACLDCGKAFFKKYELNYHLKFLCRLRAQWIKKDLQLGFVGCCQNSR